MSTYAKVVEDSITVDGDRLTTFEVRFHRFVLAEFNTHRVFSRNSASSRAIPVATQLKRVEETPATPVSWPAEQKGMQGGEEIESDQVEDQWDLAGEQAVKSARRLARLGLHKSVTNRLLEPFMWHTVVVSATAWDNFFSQRVNPNAQPEIRVAAEKMYMAYALSEPKLLGVRDWHLPYVQPEESDDPEVLLRVSAARCARVSYLTQDGVRDLDKDLDLYDRLTSATPMHASPLEHVARPEAENKHDVVVERLDRRGVVVGSKALTLPRYGNLLGWHQLRFDIEIASDYQAFA